MEERLGEEEEWSLALKRHDSFLNGGFQALGQAIRKAISVPGVFSCLSFHPAPALPPVTIAGNKCPISFPAQIGSPADQPNAELLTEA
jgi:hypothetical protein